MDTKKTTTSVRSAKTSVRRTVALQTLAQKILTTASVTMATTWTMMCARLATTNARTTQSESLGASATTPSTTAVATKDIFPGEEDRADLVDTNALRIVSRRDLAVALGRSEIASARMDISPSLTDALSATISAHQMLFQSQELHA